jgi:hypothetical protein
MSGITFLSKATAAVTCDGSSIGAPVTWSINLLRTWEFAILLLCSSVILKPGFLPAIALSLFPKLAGLRELDQISHVRIHLAYCFGLLALALCFGGYGVGHIGRLL